MKLIDLLSLLASPASCLVDLYFWEEDDELPCIWSGCAGDVPDELHDRSVESFDRGSDGLVVYLVRKECYK